MWLSFEEPYSIDFAFEKPSACEKRPLLRPVTPERGDAIDYISVFLPLT
tara:strand:+ start:404 stop:550 length:147 start_codon:yes stop_codon:yes gene_type:complete